MKFSQWLNTAKASDRHREAFRIWSNSNRTPEFRTALNSAGDDLEIQILGPIGWDGVDGESLALALNRAPLARSIRVLINSPGGIAFEGEAMRALLARHSATVTVEVLAVAASAASIVAMAGNRIEMHVGAQMMIHQASGCTWGTADDHESQARALRSLDAGLVQIYADRTGRKPAELEAMLKAETWMSPEEAIKLGFADAVLRSDPKSNATRVAPLGEEEDDEDDSDGGEMPTENRVAAKPMQALIQLNKSAVKGAFWS